MAVENGTGKSGKSAPPFTLKNAKGSFVCGSKRPGRDALCQSVAVMDNGRCSRHGGASPAPGPTHPSYTTGVRSKWGKVMPEKLRKGYEAGVSDPDLVSLRHELALLDSRTGELLDRLTGDGLEALVSKLEEISSNVVAWGGDAKGTPEREELAGEELGELVGEARALVQQLKEEGSTWREIRTTMESRRKMANSERRLLEHRAAVVEVSELRGIMAYILQSVKEHVADLNGGRDAIGFIASDVRRLMMPVEKEIEA